MKVNMFISSDTPRRSPPAWLYYRLYLQHAIVTRLAKGIDVGAIDHVVRDVAICASQCHVQQEIELSHGGESPL